MPLPTIWLISSTLTRRVAQNRTIIINFHFASYQLQIYDYARCSLTTLDERLQRLHQRRTWTCWPKKSRKCYSTRGKNHNKKKKAVLWLLVLETFFASYYFFGLLGPPSSFGQRVPSGCVISCVMSWKIGLSNLWSSGSDFCVRCIYFLLLFFTFRVRVLLAHVVDELWEFIALEWIRAILSANP